LRYGLGVDLGTATVGAAVLGPEGVEPVVLGERSVVLPAVVHVTPDGTLLTGDAAERRAAYAPQCTARSLRRALREPDPVLLDGRPYQVVDLLAALLRTVVATVAIERQATPDLVALTRPATWGRARVTQLAEVAARAGVPGAAIVTDAQAAVVHYAAEGRLPLGGRVAVFDFGGGGFEAAVLALEPDGVHLVGPPEGIEPLGGVDVDRLLLNFLDARLGGPLAGLDPLDGRGATLRERNRAECCLAKEQLSGDTEVELSLYLPDGPRVVVITRADVEAVAAAPVAAAISVLRRTMQVARVAPADLHAVLLVGGSSRMPLVAGMVAEAMGGHVPIESLDEHAVARGAAHLTREALVAPHPHARAISPTGG
jgi:molecular chaperone DnaK (HSP70)